jgi:hypothetical protein
MLASFFNEHHDLPVSSASNKVVTWHVFRTLKGQRIVGGMDSDTIGKLWWVGVEVEDIASWGNHGAVNKHAE